MEHLKTNLRWIIAVSRCKIQPNCMWLSSQLLWFRNSECSAWHPPESRELSLHNLLRYD